MQQISLNITPCLSPSIFTRRELEVGALMADGLINKEIASRLFVSEHTAKFHVDNVIRKAGRSTRAGAVAQLIRNGVVP
jgi:two-component system response regulator DevR